MNLDLSEISNKSNIILPEKITEELAEETGLHIGDGTMNFYKIDKKMKGSYALRGHIIDDREHYDKIILKLYKSLYGLNLSLRNMPSTGVYGFQKWSDELVVYKNKILGLPLGKKINVKIPEFLMSKRELITSVIRGIFDTDGMLYLQPKYRRLYPRIEIGTISKILALQLNKSINKLNIRSTLYISKSSNPKWYDIYRISVRGNEMLEKWMKIINPHNPKHIAKYEYFINSKPL